MYTMLLLHGTTGSLCDFALYFPATDERKLDYVHQLSSHKAHPAHASQKVGRRSTSQQQEQHLNHDPITNRVHEHAYSEYNE